MKTLDKVLRIKAKISKLTNEIIEIQDRCSHENVIKEARSDTGNFCKADDYYWYDCKCQDCLQTWAEDR